MSENISIIIPARNEAYHLPKCLESIAIASSGLTGSVEIIVVINRCSDNTEEIAREHSCRIVHNDSKNLAQIRNAGVAAASGDIIITIDADSRMSPTMMRAVVDALSNPKIIGGGVLILPERWSLGIVLTGLCLVPIIVYHGISGGLFFFRKPDFNAIHGFNEQLSSVEDIDFAKRLKALGRSSGRRFVSLYRSYIITSCRKFDRLGDWYFLKRPFLFMSLLRGRNQAAADKIWYDFER